jgi:hypothetical protein
MGTAARKSLTGMDRMDRIKRKEEVKTLNDERQANSLSFSVQRSDFRVFFILSILLISSVLICQFCFSVAAVSCA